MDGATSSLIFLFFSFPERQFFPVFFLDRKKNDAWGMMQAWKLWQGGLKTIGGFASSL